MDENVEFQRSDERQRDQTSEQRNAKRAADKQARATALEKVVEKNRSMAPGDQRLVADALSSLMGRAVQAGFSRRQVAESAGLQPRHLGQFTSKRVQGSERQTKRNVDKKPANYLKILKAVARETGWNRDDLVIEVFNGTDLARDSAAEIASPEYDDLAAALRDVALAVSKKHDLKEYFQTLERTRAGLSVLPEHQEKRESPLPTERIGMRFACDENQYQDHIRWPVMFHSHHPDDDFSEFEKIPPYPTIVLGRWPVRGIVPSSEVARTSWDHSGPPNDQPATGFSIELRLCIVPISTDMETDGALYVALHKEHADEARQPATRQAALTEKKRKKRAAPSDNGPGHRLIDEYFRSTDPTRPGVLSAYGVYQPITGTVCQDWLSLDWVDGDPVWPNLWRETACEPHVAVLGPPISLEDDGWSVFKRLTLAAALDLSLSGQGSLDILALFDKRADRLVKLLAEMEAEGRNIRKVGYDKLNERLEQFKHKPA